MQLKRLLVQHYRNYEQIEFQTDSMVNIIVGPNAQGKTNLLESIFVLALTKSHRTNQDKELIRWNEKTASLHAEIEKRYGTLQLDLTISQQGKRAKINGLEQKKLSNFIGSMNVVMFAPEDLEIVKGSPSVRRRFLDMEIGQVHPAYLYDLSQYNKVLQQRNNYLKQLFSSSGAAPLLEVWNEQLAQFGIKIMKKRQSFIKKLQTWAEKIHAGITNGTERLRIEYDSTFADSLEEEEAVLFDQFMIKLSQVRDQEIRRGVTMAGPHRDDLRFYINDKEAQTFGSQGQQRTTALSLKLAEIELIREEVGEYPLLLLDDVLSELDQYRQTQLIETFQRKVQTFITTTGIESIDLSKLESASVIHVRDGSFT
ncbi:MULTISPECIES: DNA replication/repair protein RecF [unclassified Paenibacillus]|uniref:DNA replication/repair protein RecF n=1 Tax=unclassified Paenibacillus TaxID=185978 RepID=UPI001AE535F5|nr:MULTISPECIES: DNA replication/repair protein RecF [unclassified Paenibacillus]MBP1153247.1 DNA replication and repair protein RecF [Paenibacillus sp. PvP091]MBP1171370.1 DNA replication and repair protein RecF [Paenibacillus sp. PvR098]MBP2442398.1 DNA replication and repair protein RecF [Paenibacillus sp. PvP052]